MIAPKWLLLAAAASAALSCAPRSARAGGEKISLDAAPLPGDREDIYVTQTVYGKPPTKQTESEFVRDTVKEVAPNGDVTILNALGGSPTDPVGPHPRVLVFDRHGALQSAGVTDGPSNDILSRPVRLSLALASRPSRPNAPVRVGEKWKRTYADPAAPGNAFIVEAAFAGEESHDGMSFYKIVQTATISWRSGGKARRFSVTTDTWIVKSPDSLTTREFISRFEARNLPTQSPSVAMDFGRQVLVRGSSVLYRFSRNGTTLFSNERGKGILSSRAYVVRCLPQPRRGFLRVARPFKAGAEYPETYA